MKRRLQVLVFLLALFVAMVLILYTRGQAAQVFSGPGQFISQNACTDIVNPVSGQTWCYDSTNDSISVWTGSAYSLQMALSTNAVTLGVNGSAGGELCLNGATSGSACIKVATAAGAAVPFALPTALGSNGNALITDGAGNYNPGAISINGSSIYFGGSVVINASTPTTAQAGPVANFKATRPLTVDNCVASWTALGSCGTFPVISIVDETAVTTICSATGTNTGTTATQTVTTNSIPAEDVVIVGISTPPATCASLNNNLTLGMTYH